MWKTDFIFAVPITKSYNYLQGRHTLMLYFTCCDLLRRTLKYTNHAFLCPCILLPHFFAHDVHLGLSWFFTDIFSFKFFRLARPRPFIVWCFFIINVEVPFKKLINLFRTSINSTTHTSKNFEENCAPGLIAVREVYIKRPTPSRCVELDHYKSYNIIIFNHLQHSQNRIRNNNVNFLPSFP